MRESRWPHVPVAVIQQVHQLVAAVQKAASDNVCGIYLHGSLAMGGFNPDQSDIDVLAVTRERLSLAAQVRLTSQLLELSGQPCPIEISTITWAQISSWQFPPLFDYHFSEAWRKQLAAAGAWVALDDAPQYDPDLAAHITVIHHRGLVLCGDSPGLVLPEVPPGDFLAAIWDHDTKAALTQLTDDPAYYVLNLCRILLFVLDGRIVSKAEGGEWALGALPDEFRPVVELAWGLYRGIASTMGDVTAADLIRFGEYMESRIEKQKRATTGSSC